MNNIALVFPGQGSQYIGMCRDLSSSDYFNDYFGKASDLFGVDLLSYCYNGPDDKLNSTYIAQPAILIHSIIIDKILKWNKINVHAVAGHSLGEYSALISSGIISFDDCLKILKVRCQEMQIATEKYNGTMVAVISDNLKLIKKICENFSKTVIANINSNNQIIVSGPLDEIDKTIYLLKKNNIRKVIKLNVSGAFHSPLMSSARDNLTAILGSIEFNDAKFPIVQNATAEAEMSGNELKNNLISQLESPVKWSDSIELISNSGFDHFIECGPGKILSGLNHKILKNSINLNIGTIQQINEFEA